MDETVFARGIKSYVLRAGRMTAAQERAYRAFAPRYGVPFGTEYLDFTTLFGNKNPVTVEIGFGMGIATAQIAAVNPEQNYLGLEVHRPGVGRLLWEIESRALTNIRIIEHDAVEVLLKMVPAASVGAFHVFFPDPWPKKRHHKRRLITRPFTGLLAQKLAPGGYVYMVTDWEDYAAWALQELSVTVGLVNVYGGCGGDCTGGYSPRQTWRPRTKFETKGLAKQHVVKELFFRRGP